MKKVLSTAALLLILLGGGILYLYMTDYWSEKNRALRELKSREIPPTPMQVKTAVFEKNLETLHLLGKAEVDFNAPDAINAQGDSPLHVAVKNEEWNTLETLLLYGADPDLKDATDLPVTTYLLEAEKTELASKLFKNGAAVNIPHPSGEPALIHAIKADQVKKALFLLQHGASPETASSSAENALFLSLKRKLPALRKALFQHGVNPNSTTPEGTALLTYFCKNLPSLGYSPEETQDILQDFLHHNTDLNALDQAGKRPLQWLLSHKKHEAAELLLEKDQNVQDTLWITLNNNDYPMAKRLLALNADPNQQNSAGHTPLLAMIRRNRADMVKALLHYGVDPEQDGIEGESALVTAIALKHSDSALALLRHPERPAQHSRLMSENVSEEFRELFGKKGYFDWYCRNCPGLTPLMAAVMMKELAVAEQLLKNGADRYQGTTSKYAVFPIQMAANNKDVKMQQLLIGVSYKEEDQVRKFIVDLSEQTVRYYENGELKKTSRCSTGRYGYRTEPGHYVITDKTRHKRSNIYDGADMPYFQRFSCGAIGFHEGNTYSRFASHGCIRLPMSTAKYFWGETQLGDLVEIRK